MSEDVKLPEELRAALTRLEERCAYMAPEAMGAEVRDVVAWCREHHEVLRPPSRVRRTVDGSVCYQDSRLGHIFVSFCGTPSFRKTGAIDHLAPMSSRELDEFIAGLQDIARMKRESGDE